MARRALSPRLPHDLRVLVLLFWRATSARRPVLRRWPVRARADVAQSYTFEARTQTLFVFTNALRASEIAAEIMSAK